jgi:hypothetical protein
MIPKHLQYTALALPASAFPLSAHCFTAYMPVEEPSVFDGFGDLFWPSQDHWPDVAEDHHGG